MSPAAQIENGRGGHARVGYGSVAPIPRQRARAKEQRVGKGLSRTVIEATVAAACEGRLKEEH